MKEKLVWSTADELALQALQERKQAVAGQKRAAVEKEVACLFYRGMGPDDLVDALIENAEAIRDALEPYDSGVRPAKVED